MGGPFVSLLLALGLGACLGGALPADLPPPRELELTARPGDVYRRLGFLAGPPSYAAVADFATLAGPADSTFVVFGMSLPAGALRFQRDEGGFRADYEVELAFVHEGVTAKRLQHRPQVRVATFAETSRTDESIVFQLTTALLPGVYEVQLRSNDAHSTRGFRAVDTLHVPAYGAGRAQLGSLLVVHDSVARYERSDLPGFVMNPRRTILFGRGDAFVYAEHYDAAPATVQLRVRDEHGAIVWMANANTRGTGGDVNSVNFGVPVDTLPLGRLTLQLTSGTETGAEVTILHTISDRWLVSSHAEVLELLRPIATPQELEALGSASAAERRDAWNTFWKERDALTPDGTTARDEFFSRVRYAADHYSDTGRAGWRTDRGEVYIVLGPPDQTHERFPGRSAVGAAGVEWVYDHPVLGRLQLLFVDRNGFGRYELVPASLAAFRIAAERLRQHATEP